MLYFFDRIYRIYRINWSHLVDYYVSSNMSSNLNSSLNSCVIRLFDLQDLH